MFVNFNILNQLGSPAINSNTFANRPAAGQTGRLFVSTDTFEIYRDNGTTWDLIGGPGTSTITGTGTATQVAYFTSSQAIGSSSNLYWDNANSRLGIGTSSPGVRLDVHGTGIMQHINATSGTANALMAFQRTGTTLWRVGDVYAGGNNYFEIYNNSTGYPAFFMRGASNQTIFTAGGNYSGAFGSVGNQFTFSHVLPAGTTVAAPDSITAVNSYLDLSVGGNVTIANGTRQGLEGNSRISFSGAGTMTVAQGSKLRAFSALSTVYSFAGSAVGTITHLAGMRMCFPDNVGSAVNVTNNYAILINDQSTGLGTVTYTNRWGIYQEGASDLNYFAANLLLGSTTNTGERLQVTGTSLFTGNITNSINSFDTSQLTLLNNAASATQKTHIGSFAGNTYISTNWYFNGSAAYDDNTKNSNSIVLNGDGTIDINTANAGNTAPTTKIKLTEAGNVGIGTTLPNTILDVNGTINVRTNGFEFGRITTNNVTGNIGGLTFQYNSSGTFTTGMVLNGAGNVGIGTTSPFSQGSGAISTEIAGTGYGQLFVSANSAAVRGTLMARNPTSDVYIASITNHSLILGTNDTERARITSGGNVLIGTTTDAGRTLYLNGSLRIDTQGSATAGSDSGMYLAINVDGTQYKIKLFNNA